MSTNNILAEIEELINSGNKEAGLSLLKNYAVTLKSQTSRLSVLNFYRKISSKLDLRKYKVAILRSVTVEPLIPYFELDAFLNDIEIEIYVAPFNSFEVELLNKNSDIFSFNPDLTLVYLRGEEIIDNLYSSFTEIAVGNFSKIHKEIIERQKNIVKLIEDNLSSKILITNFPRPVNLAFGVFDGSFTKSHYRFIDKLNLDLAILYENSSRVNILDIDYLSNKIGLDNWYNRKMWYSSKAPLSVKSYSFLSFFFIRILISIIGQTKKVIVLDLDNTLWGGVLGEEGVSGIDLGEDSAGLPYLDFQRELLNYYNNGFLLCICSKNNLENVEEVFASHEYMLLKEKYFASMRINWQDKASNIREMASELNLGLDSFIFIDDNPVERNLVRHQLPMVTVLELSEKPIDYIESLDSVIGLDRLTYTKEDKERGEMYRAQVDRKKLESSTDSLEDFFHLLNSRAVIKVNDEQNIPRLAIMTQKTNQFNLTTIRYQEEDIYRFIQSKTNLVLSMSLSDKFGNNGLVGMIIIDKYKNYWSINTFLLSCRVMGRYAENALFSYLSKISLDDNNTIIRGKYIKTDRNQPVKNLFKDYGFNLIKKENDEEIWEIDLKKERVECPSWIKINNE